MKRLQDVYNPAPRNDWEAYQEAEESRERFMEYVLDGRL